MPTTIKAALKRWEEATGKKSGEAREIKLIGVYPPIEKMEGPFHLLINCEKFSLSTNLISSIANVQAFKCLKVLSLGRNHIKSLQGIEAAAETLEQLWISYNQIDRLKPLRSLAKLKVLYMAHNFVREWREFEHLTELPCLEDLVFVGNPLEEEATLAGKYTDEVTKRLLLLKKLDGYPVIREMDDDDGEEVSSTMDIKEINRMARDFDDDDDDDDRDHVDDMAAKAHDADADGRIRGPAGSPAGRKAVAARMVDSDGLVLPMATAAVAAADEEDEEDDEEAHGDEDEFEEEEEEEEEAEF